jgi:predicted PurR-regulated permease PerM
MTPPEGRVPAWLRRAILLLLLGAAALVIAFWLVVRLRSLIVTLLVSLFLAFAMEPAANFLARSGWRRGLATAAVFAALVVGVVLFVTALGSLLVGQVADLADAIPGYAQQLADFSTRPSAPTSTAASWPSSSRATRACATSPAASWRPRWACPPPWSGWCCRASPSGCSPST